MINLLNYYIHPGDNRYIIFEFRDVEKAMNFEQLLEEQNVTFEKMVEDDEVWKSLYAVSKTFSKEAIRANNLTESKFRKPMIPNRWGGYLLLLITGSLIAFAFWGYLKSH